MKVDLPYKFLIFKLRSGEYWAVPVKTIAHNRAEHFASDYGSSVLRSMNEDTMPLFESDSSEVMDWAMTQMDWADVASTAFKIKDRPVSNFQEEWIRADFGLRSNLTSSERSVAEKS